jgi:hypothetical protein
MCPTETCDAKGGRRAKTNARAQLRMPLVSLKDTPQARRALLKSICTPTTACTARRRKRVAAPPPSRPIRPLLRAPTHEERVEVLDALAVLRIDVVVWLGRVGKGWGGRGWVVPCKEPPSHPQKRLALPAKTGAPALPHPVPRPALDAWGSLYFFRYLLLLPFMLMHTQFRT